MPQTPPARPAALAALVLLTCAHASVNSQAAMRSAHDTRSYKLSRKVELPPGCLYDGRWHADGSQVRTREACLVCACARGALSCHRATCGHLPEPPPLCQLVHRRDECCPELHCPDGVKSLQQRPSARLDDDPAPGSIGHVLPACVEGGTVYAAGSAMSSNTACEQCFCLGGARRCVRPRCLPSPDGCQPQPAPGACCPQRYYCQHFSTTPPYVKNPHDCQTQDGMWVSEGDKVTSLDGSSECVQCFCLRGSIRCQSLSCAPTLKGCTPLVLPGQCCPHQYQCSNQRNDTIISNLFIKRDNHLMPLSENRAFHSSKSTKRETTIKTMSSLVNKSQGLTSVENKQTSTENPLVMDIEKDMKINLRSTEPSDKEEEKDDTVEEDEEELESTTKEESTRSESSTTKTFTTLADEITSTSDSLDSTNTDQPERSVKIVINGTVNCTTELSSSTLLLNTTDTSNTVWIKSDIHPRIPFIDDNESESHTAVPNDIITKRIYSEDYTDNDSFTINVTSSLLTNNSNVQISSTTTSTTARPKTVPPILVDGVNASKSKKDELDYDYNEPTLPPSLPNLKIIPFVAADAVVDEEVLPRDTPTFTTAQVENRFPVYYPGVETKESSYPTRREDNYNVAEYPVFVSKERDDLSHSPPTHREDTVNPTHENTTIDEDVPVHEFTVAALLSNMADVHHKPHNKLANPAKDNRNQALNLFSPPAETEGGFVPKNPGAGDEFYSIYSSTPPGPAAPHQTTSIQIKTKEDCTSNDGRHIVDGTSINIGCSICTCAWSELHCSPRVCSTPPGCRWQAASVHADDICCGELICDHENTTKVLTNTIKYIINTTEPAKMSTEDNISNKNITILSNTQPLLDNKLLLDNKEEKDMQIEKQYAIPVNESQAEGAKIKPITTETIPKLNIDDTANSSQSFEYVEDEDDDGGFSLGSVLKLLLSNNYDSKTTITTASPTKRTTTIFVGPKPKPSTTKATTSETVTSINEDDDFNKFIPMPQFKPVPNSINRIDHLLLGEPSAITDNPRPSSPKVSSRTTLRPNIATTKRPIPVKSTRKPYTTKSTTNREITTEAIQTHVHTVPQSPYPSGHGLGLPKLAGCNIYGQMYRVGRIITELSTPCQECRCTEFGVDCKSLNC